MFDSFLFLLLTFNLHGLSDTNNFKYLKDSLNNKCENEVIVAIIDTGIDYNHDYLKKNFYINKNEQLNNIDSDKNGFIDDISGWNFVKKNNKPYDIHGHGTNIAGLIVGINNYNKCIKILNLKFYSAMGYSNSTRLHDSIRYCINNKVNIINYSGGGFNASYIERKLIEKAQQNGILFIAAAGNDNSNNEKNPYYPASYILDNIISVAAYDFKKNDFTYFSNYGENVHVIANGSDVYSTLPNNKYGFMSGTSQATAVISNKAANLWLKYKNYKKVREELFKSTKPYKINKKYVKYGLIE